MGRINPYFCNFHLFHYVLFFKIVLPPFCNYLYIFFYDRLNYCYLLFLESMIIDLLYWTDIIFCFTIILDYMNMNWFMII